MLTILLAGQRPKASEGTHRLQRSATSSSGPLINWRFSQHARTDQSSLTTTLLLTSTTVSKVALISALHGQIAPYWRLLPEPGSDQDPASSSLEPFRQRFAGSDIDIITIANQRESHRTQPTGIRSASLAWDQLTSELTELGPMLPEAEQSWLDRFVALTSEVTGSEPAG